MTIPEKATEGCCAAYLPRGERGNLCSVWTLPENALLNGLHLARCMAYGRCYVPFNNATTWASTTLMMEMLVSAPETACSGRQPVRTPPGACLSHLQCM